MLTLNAKCWFNFGLQTVEYLHNRIDTPTVTLPHAPEPRLPSDIPDLQTNQTSVEWLETSFPLCKKVSIFNYLYRDVSFRDLPHIEPDRGDHVFTEMPRLKEKKA